MKIINRLTSVVLSMAVIAPSFNGTVKASTSGTFTDMNADIVSYNAVERLHSLDIIDGYDDGEYKPYNYVTRAEFCKIVVAMSDKITEAKSTAPTSGFDDVNEAAWSIPYVNYLTGNGIIKGYADATFRPNNVITYAEAVTILCRLLNYKEETVGYNWPANYINQADALELHDGMNFSANDAVTRSAMAIIVYNTLFSDINGAVVSSGGQNQQSQNQSQSSGNQGQTSRGKTFIESIGYSIVEDVYLLESSKVNSNLKSDEIKTSQDTYKIIDKRLLNDMGKKGDIVLNEDKEMVLFIPENESSIFDSITTKEDYLTLESHGFIVTENCYIIATKEQDEALNSYEVKTSSGVLKSVNEDVFDAVGKKGTIIQNADKEIVYFFPLSDNSIFDANITKEDYASLKSINYNVIEGCMIIATRNEDDSLNTYEVKTSAGNYTSMCDEVFTSVGVEGTVIINDEKEIVYFFPTVKNSLFDANITKEDYMTLKDIGYDVIEDCLIAATRNEDKTLGSYDVKTSSGIFTSLADEVFTSVGLKGDIILNDEKKILYFYPTTTESIFTKTLTNDDYLLLQTVGYNIIDNCFILATKAQDSDLNANQIKTSSGTYAVQNTDILSKVNKMGTLILNTLNQAVYFYERPLESETVTVTKLSTTLNDTYEYRTDTSEKGSFTFNSTFVIYKDNAKSNYLAQSNNIKVGTSLTFYSEANQPWSFAVINSQADTTTVIPVKATKNYSSSATYLEGIKINYKDLTVYRENKTASVDDIEINDVIYYDTFENVMDVYNKKITGIYNEAMPSKAYVTSVDVGGNIYSLNPDVEPVKLDATAGSFEIGERVTLLLGKNDEVCFAVEAPEMSGFAIEDYGVVLKTYKELSNSGANKGSSQIMASILMSDGNTYEYQTAQNYSSYVGKLVKLDFKDGIVSMSNVSSSNIYGELNVSQRKLDDKTVLKDAVVFHRLSDDEAEIAEVEILDFDRLTAKSIGVGNLITSVSVNAFDDIAILYLQGMSSGFKYGVIRGTQSLGADSTATMYTIYADGVNTDYQSDARYSNASGPVYFTLSNGKITSLSPLYSIVSNNSISAVETGRIKIGGRVYKMDDNVLIVNKTDISNYKTMSVDELKNSAVYRVSAYSETNSQDAYIRVLMVEVR